MSIVDQVESILIVKDSLLIAILRVQFLHDARSVDLTDTANVVDPEVSCGTKDSAELVQTALCHDSAEDLPCEVIPGSVAFLVVHQMVKIPHLSRKVTLHGFQCIIENSFKKKRMVSKQ